MYRLYSNGTAILLQTMYTSQCLHTYSNLTLTARMLYPPSLAVCIVGICFQLACTRNDEAVWARILVRRCPPFQGEDT